MHCLRNTFHTLLRRLRNNLAIPYRTMPVSIWLSMCNRVKMVRYLSMTNRISVYCRIMLIRSYREIGAVSSSIIHRKTFALII